MMFARSTRRIFCSVATAAAAFTATANAQSVPAPTAFSVNVGAFDYDLAGVGVAPMLAVRADFPLGQVVLVEGSLGLTRPETSFGDRSTMMIPEVQFQAQLPLGRVLPYLGVGAGAALDFRGSRAGGLQSDFTGSAAGGVRAWVNDRVGLRAELRVRGIGGGFEGSAAEWTGGLTWRM